MDDVGVLTDERAAVLVLDPLRRSILAALRTPGSAASVADGLGISRQRARYFLTTLADRGLIRAAGERAWGGITERMYVASATGYVVSPDALGEIAATPRAVTDRLSARYLIALAAQAVRDVAALAERAKRQRKSLPTLSLDTTIRFASTADRAAFADELGATVRTLAARYHRPTAPRGRDHQLLVLAYPTNTADAPDQERR